LATAKSQLQASTEEKKTFILRKMMASTTVITIIIIITMHYWDKAVITDQMNITISPI
jgi:ATP/ADP translocase